MTHRMWPKRKSKIYDKAMRLFNQGQYRQAIPLFHQVMTASSETRGMRYRLASFYCAQSYFELGMVLYAMGNYNGAMREFEQVLRVDPERARAYEYIGHCAEKVGAGEDALEVYCRISDVKPFDYPARLKIVSAFHRLGIWERVEAACLERIQNNPDHADIYYMLGLTYLGTGRPYQAIKAFEEAVTINPQYWSARLRLGAAYATAGKRESAGGQFSMMLEQFPDYIDLYHHLGVVQADRPDASNCRYETSLKLFRRALSGNPQYVDARIKQALMLCAAGHFNQGIQTLREGRRINPEEPSLALLLDFFEKNRAATEIENAEKRTLEALLTETVGAFGRNLPAAPSVVEMLLLIRPIEDANLPVLLSSVIEVVKCAAHLYDAFPDFHYSLGFLQYRAHSLDAAEASFNKALSLNPSYKQAKIMLFNTLKTAEKKKLALDAGNELFAGGLDYPDFLLAFGKLSLDMKRYAQAERSFKKLLERKPDDADGHALLKQVLDKKKDL